VLGTTLRLHPSGSVPRFKKALSTLPGTRMSPSRVSLPPDQEVPFEAMARWKGRPTWLDAGPAHVHALIASRPTSQGCEPVNWSLTKFDRVNSSPFFAQSIDICPTRRAWWSSAVRRNYRVPLHGPKSDVDVFAGLTDEFIEAAGSQEETGLAIAIEKRRSPNPVQLRNRVRA